MLITVWDYFLVDGWKSIFKIILYIIGEFKKEFLLYKIHDILSLFYDITKAKILYDHSAALKLKEKYKSIKVTNTLLNKLRQEYKNIYDNIFKVKTDPI